MYALRCCRIIFVAICFLPFALPATGSAQFIRPERRTQPPRQAKPQKPDSNTPEPRRSTATESVGETPTTLNAGLALQIALEREGFSPGLLDGAIGRKTRIAMAVLQAYHGREPTGELDDATRALLDLDRIETTRNHKITDADVARVGPCPTDWLERSQAKRLPFPTLLDVLVFEGHCSKGLIKQLNPNIDVDALRVGDTVALPNVYKPRRTPHLTSLDIDFDNKLIGGRDEKGRIAVLFHCSIARERHNRPNGDCRVNAIAVNPEYTFRPESWPEVKGIDHVLMIPPGPRNPVGMCWIDLSVDGYGIHGTPEPEMIGKTGSHGCFRMTNWDVLRLSKMVKPGLEVRFIEDDQRVASAE